LGLVATKRREPSHGTVRYSKLDKMIPMTAFQPKKGR
jgi:hypothetical protein